MRKLTLVFALSLAFALAMTGSVGAAPSVFGISGNIITPDDTIVPPSGFNLAYHGISDSGTDSIFAGNVGLLPNLEVGAAFVTNGDDDLMVNAKYRVLAETGNRPAVTIGAIDIGSTVFNDAGLFIVLSKSLTATAEEAFDRPSVPLRGHLGIGDGPLDTLFFALDWTVNPQLSLMFEFISDGSVFNGGLRYAISDNVRLDLGLIDFDDVYFGASYQTLRF